MRRWRERFWPTIDSPLSARRAVERAARITTLWAFVNVALGLVMTFSGTKATDASSGRDKPFRELHSSCRAFCMG
jgi:hypothetical protein